MRDLLDFLQKECLNSFEQIKQQTRDSDRFILSKLQGDASSRQYYRLQDKNTFSSLIIMLLPENFQNSDEGVVANKIEDEVNTTYQLPFIIVQDVLKKSSVYVPEIYSFIPDERILTLEDLQDTTLQLYLDMNNNNEIELWYERCIGQMLSMHNYATDLCNESKNIVYQKRFDKELFHWEFMHFSEYGLCTARCLSRDNEHPNQSEQNKLNYIYHDISNILSNEPVVFTHRDFHSRNLMIKNNRLFNIDFQDALMAPATYDLASLLFDAYVKVPKNLIESMIWLYHKESKINSSARHFRKVVDLTAIHRTLKAAGRFEFIRIEKGNDTLVSYIKPALENAITVLKKYKEYEFLHDMIMKYHPQFNSK
ncbi:MAG: phosphotransferase [Pseudomonadota bacterium]